MLNDRIFEIRTYPITLSKHSNASTKFNIIDAFISWNQNFRTQSLSSQGVKSLNLKFYSFSLGCSSRESQGTSVSNVQSIHTCCSRGILQQFGTLITKIVKVAYNYLRRSRKYKIIWAYIIKTIEYITKLTLAMKVSQYLLRQQAKNIIQIKREWVSE